MALKFQKSFRIMEGKGNYKNYFQEKEDDKVKRDGLLIDLHWENANVFVKFLMTFYETTLKFSGFIHVTSSSYFQEVFEIRQDLNILIED